MLLLQNIQYIHPDREILFDNINLSVKQHDKIALTGNNGTGKSTLLQIIAGERSPSGGQLVTSSQPYYVPQIFGQFDHLTIAQALGVDQKICALHEILNGHTTDRNFQLLNDDWTIEERSIEALANWQLHQPDLSQPMATLSGGQKTKLFLAGIAIHQPQLVLLDEPSNHLDLAGRKLLYEFIQSTTSTLIIVSHDRRLLNLVNTVCELSSQGITIYGGNYDFYRQQKGIAQQALEQDIQANEKALRKAKEKERETIERQQKLNSRGKKKQEKAGVARIMMNTLRNKAESSTSKLKSVHTEKIEGLGGQLQELRAALPGIAGMKFGFSHSHLHKGKILFTASQMNLSYGQQMLWPENLDIQINSGERIAIQGRNGSGKTTLIKLILGQLQPHAGTIFRAEARAVYIDQDYSLIQNNLTVWQQVMQYNTSALQDHEIGIRLTRFLFNRNDWNKPTKALSGGERMRLMLCCITLPGQAPDMLILDEPTNNLDITNLEILTAAVNEYEGTLLVVSHDESFLEQIAIQRTFSV